jgi:hypothetical protein
MLRGGLPKGIKIYVTKLLSHLLFIDDVILFGVGYVQEF